MVHIATLQVRSPFSVTALKFSLTPPAQWRDRLLVALMEAETSGQTPSPAVRKSRLSPLKPLQIVPGAVSPEVRQAEEQQQVTTCVYLECSSRASVATEMGFKLPPLRGMT